MKLAERYVKWEEEKRLLFWLIVVDVFGLAVFVPFFLLSNSGLFFGWLLGSAVEIICYLTMVYGSSLVLDYSSKRGGRERGIAVTLAFAALRFLLAVGSLVLAAFLTFKTEGKAINFFTTAGAYLPLVIVSIVFTLIHNREKKKGDKDAKKEEKPLEKGEEAIDE